ncbi:hypothetical protein BDV29DRAFT_151705 [Aspergillus leporis]|uniref:Uncharacterized protein n=1 Tax=Aspergillus leporis TaxID=41062 RepID=A0A5N5XGS7_9EURO|nr:hypothetical protein BDV29DRAFT_151705 [Aspergillus leporis]
MSEESHPRRHQGILDRMLHHKHPLQAEDQHQNQHDSQDKEPQKKEEEGELDKIKDYVKKDQELEEEGDTYAGLM